MWRCAKHAPTAFHSLRVAFGCSSWALQLDLQEPTRDEWEVAALLHDIGKIGVPDRILSKPQRLDREEMATMNRHRVLGEQILASCCVSQEVLVVVRYARLVRREPYRFRSLRPRTSLRCSSHFDPGRFRCDDDRPGLSARDVA